MTVKELSKLLEVSKNTINNKVKKLHIEPQIKGNRYELNDNDVQNIIKSIYPSNFQEYFDKANLEKSSKAEITKNEQIDKEIDKIDNQNEKIDNQINQNDKNNAQNDKENAQTAQTINDKLISMLEKSLADKEETIKAQQKQIEMLITTNAALTAKLTMLEDKSQKQNDIFESNQAAAANQSEQTEEEPKIKKRWWEKLFA